MCGEKPFYGTSSYRSLFFFISIFLNLRSTLVRLLVKCWKDENVFSSVNSSLLLGLSAVVAGCNSLLSRVKDRFQSAPVSWPSCRQEVSIPVHARAWESCLPYSVTNSVFFYSKFSGPPMPYFWRYKRPSILIPHLIVPNKVICF